MSGYKTFAVAGAGNLGKLVVEELLKKKDEGIVSSVLILSRSASGHDGLVAKGAKVAAVDYASVTSLQSALVGVDVVICLIADFGDAPKNLAVASKSAGVKLFVPNEFGAQTDGVTEGIVSVKDTFKKKVLKDELKLPYAVYYTGGFTDMVFGRGFTKAIGFDFDNRKITIQGAGEAPIGWTMISDIARFVAYSLTALPRSRIEWGYFRIEGDRVSFNKIAEDYAARSGKDISITHRTRSDLEETVAKNPNDHYTFIVLQWDKGNGTSGKLEEISNDEFPDWKPKKVVDFLLEAYGQ